jgi:hypothetical protein
MGLGGRIIGSSICVRFMGSSYTRLLCCDGIQESGAKVSVSLWCVIKVYKEEGFFGEGVRVGIGCLRLVC